PAQFAARCRRDTANGQPIPGFCALPAVNIREIAGIASPPGRSYYPPLYCPAGALYSRWLSSRGRPGLVLEPAMHDRAPDSRTADWRARSLRHVWHPCTQMKRQAAMPLLALARGAGPWLVDMDGRRYLDAISSWWVNLFGHANARINAALHDQLARLPHAMLAGCTHAPAVELAERLSALTGGALGHCFYASDGASAVEIA